jgi:ABC-type multidrug transport system ATPase subunit
LSKAAADLLPLPAGLVAVTGDEGAGKTTLLRGLQGKHAIWLDLSLPGCDAQTPLEVWQDVRPQWPAWDEGLQAALVDALRLAPHRDKQLFMLSTGSRRKVALVALLCSGATVTCLDQPFAALDAASARVLREFLADAADHATRSWVVADYTADPRLPWQSHVCLG